MKLLLRILRFLLPVHEPLPDPDGGWMDFDGIKIKDHTHESYQALKQTVNKGQPL